MYIVYIVSIYMCVCIFYVFACFVCIQLVKVVDAKQCNKHIDVWRHLTYSPCLPRRNGGGGSGGFLQLKAFNLDYLEDAQSGDLVADNLPTNRHWFRRSRSYNFARNNHWWYLFLSDGSIDSMLLKGITADIGARIILAPSFGISLEDMKTKIKGKVLPSASQFFCWIWNLGFSLWKVSSRHCYCSLPPGNH